MVSCMYSLNSHRSSSRWLRTGLALLVMAFVLSTIAHAGHVHTRHDQTAHSHLCDYCVGFAHLGATSTNTATLAMALFFDEAPLTGATHAPYVITHTVAQARAPPR